MGEYDDRVKSMSDEELIELIKYSNTSYRNMDYKRFGKTTPSQFRSMFNSDDLAPMDMKGFLTTKEQWKEIKNSVDLFYKLLEERGLDADRYNLERLANMVLEDERGKNRSKDKDKSGFVYLLKGDDCYKIGKSKEPKTRTERLAVKLPFEVELVHTVESNRHSKLEKFLHNKFSDKKVNGEWFDLDKKDVEYIKNMEGDEYGKC